jgi:hypothetical protein
MILDQYEKIPREIRPEDIKFGGRDFLVMPDSGQFGQAPVCRGA